MRLAAHLTGYRIDIKSASEYEKMEAQELQTEEVAQESEVISDKAE